MVIRDPGGEPVAGARLQAVTRSSELFGERRPGRRQVWARAPLREIADAAGRALLLRADGERLSLRAFAPGFAPGRPVDAAGAAVELPLSAGREVTIAVVDAAGRPLPEALILLGRGRWAAAQTGGDGRARARLHEQLTVRAVTAERAAGEVTVGEEVELLSLRVTDRWPIRGRVIDARNRQPLAGAFVWSGGDADQFARTDGGGRFLLPAASPRGSTWLWAAAPGYLPEQIEVRVARELEAVLALAPAAAASGEVVDASGSPVAGAAVTARAVTAGRQAFSLFTGQEPRALSREDGSFRIGRLMPEVPLELEARVAGFAPAGVRLEPLAPRESRAGVLLVLRRGASLSGRVIAVGEPVAGAEIAALRQPSATTPVMLIRARQTAADPIAAASDGEGSFVLPNLAPGSYQLTVRAAGHAPLRVPGIELDEAAGSTDLGVLELEPGASIRGLVVDADGGPIAGAEIRASSRESQVISMMVWRRDDRPAALTGADGHFEIADRRHGERVDLEVSYKGHQPARARAVEAPTETPVRIVLERAARVAGTVLGAGGEPIAGAQVLVAAEEALTGGGALRSPAHGRSDDRGRFAIDSAPSGRVRLIATAPGWRAAESGAELEPGSALEGLRLVLERGATVAGRVLEADGKPALGAWVRVENQGGNPWARPPTARVDGDGNYLLEGVEPGLRLLVAESPEREETAREIEVTPGSNRLDLRFAGGVELAGRVTDAAGLPLADVALTLASEGVGWQGAETLSREDGSFGFDGVRDGHYLLRAAKAGYASTTLEPPLRVAGAALTGIEVRLEAGGTIRGRLVGLEAAQIPLVTVSAFRPSDEWALGRVDRDGEYRIADLSPGEWNVGAMVADGAQARGRVTLTRGGEATLDLDFGGGLTLTGQVLSAGQPVTGIDVWLRGLDVIDWGHAPTDLEGRFRIAGLEPGRHRLEISDSRSGLRHREEFELDGDRDVVVELFTTRVAGRVLDAEEGSPLAGAELSLEPVVESAGRTAFDRAQATSDAEGRFALAEVAAGGYLLRAVHEGYAPAVMALAVEAGAAVPELELRLEASSGLRLRVRGPTGAPVTQLSFAVIDADGRTLVAGRRHADESGRVRLPSVPAGTFELLLAAPGAAVNRLTVDHRTSPVEIDLAAGCRLEVTVEELAADQLNGTLRLYTADGRPFITPRWGLALQEWQMTFGAHWVEALPAGSYTAEVTAADGRSWRGTARVTPGAPNRLDL